MEGAVEVGGFFIKFLTDNFKMNFWEENEKLQKLDNFEIDSPEIFIGSLGKIMAPFWKDFDGIGVYGMNN